MKNIKMPIVDIGLVWGKIANIWGQVGIIASVVSFIMTIGIFYTTTAYPNWGLPLWAYLLIIIIGAIFVIGFIVKWGISGYYRFFSNQSAITSLHSRIDELEGKLDLIMKHLNIQKEEKK
jgi:glucan phosphoethanolaminetransferase (alkaline phosphatase superfamily)